MTNITEKINLAITYPSSKLLINCPRQCGSTKTLISYAIKLHDNGDKVGFIVNDNIWLNTMRNHVSQLDTGIYDHTDPDFIGMDWGKYDTIIFDLAAGMNSIFETVECILNHDFPPKLILYTSGLNDEKWQGQVRKFNGIGFTSININHENIIDDFEDISGLKMVNKFNQEYVMQ